MAPGALQEATIKDLTNGEIVRCIFRPKEYTFAKQNQFTPGKAAGASFQPPKFNGGQPKTLQVELMFDTYEVGTDVRNVTGALWKMMKVTPKRMDPATKKS